MKSADASKADVYRDTRSCLLGLHRISQHVKSLGLCVDRPAYVFREGMHRPRRMNIGESVGKLNMGGAFLGRLSSDHCRP